MTPDEIEKDREMPSTSWAVWAWQAYRDGALVDPATLTAENAALKERVAKLETALHPFSKTAGEMFSRNWEKDDVALKFVTKGKAFIVTFSDFLNAHAALEKHHDRP